MIVKFSDAVYIDVVTGVNHEKASNALLFSSGVSFKRIKPSTKYKKKIGNVWISVAKLSLEYLMACYMLKEDKKRIAGFYHIDSERYLVIEFELTTQGGVKWIATASVQKETPKDYLAIEDKTFDAVFGNTDVSNTKIDFQKLSKDMSGGLSVPVQIAVAASALLLCGVVVYYFFLAPTPKAKPQVADQKAQPLQLTVEETGSLESAVLYEMVDAFNKLAADSGGTRYSVRSRLPRRAPPIKSPERSMYGTSPITRMQLLRRRAIILHGKII